MSVAGLESCHRIALTASQPVRWQNFNPTSNPAGKQTLCAAGFRPCDTQ